MRGDIEVPGFVDLQCNGGFGIHLTDEPERLWELGALLPRTGVTAWCPTIVTSPPAITERALATLAAGPPDGWVVARPLGLHLEGPFLSPVRAGAHDRGRISAVDEARAAAWSREGGVAIVTLAPELPGALDLVRSLAGRGVVVSAGHSDASETEARAAVVAGVTMVTHLFNAMAPLHHREPGLAGVALAEPRLHVGVIADGVHLHPTTVAAAHRALGDRFVLVTDAVAALGTPGSTGTGVRLADGTLAGCDTPMDAALRNLAAFAGVPLETAVGAATTAPAALLGIDLPGDDVVVLSDDGHVVETRIGGAVAWRA